jgi:NACalpha-BTF3-like transcription factor
MAIVGVNRPMPTQKGQSVREPSFIDKSMDRLLKGLQIASTGYGIAVNMDRAEALRAQTAQTQAQTAALPSPEEAQTMRGAELETEQAQIRNLENQISQRTRKTDQDLVESQARISKLQTEARSPEAQTKLRKEWKSDPITKATQTGKVAIDKVLSAGEGDPNAIKDHSLVFNYMRMVDPGSTVREGEFTTVQEAGGVVDRFTVGLFNRTLQGEMLTPTQREQLIETSQALWQKQVDAQNQINSEYSRLAGQAGLDPSQVVLDLGIEQRQAGQAPQGVPAQFSEEEIKAVMDATGGSRADAIFRLKSVSGGQ